VKRPMTTGQMNRESRLIEHLAQIIPSIRLTAEGVTIRAAIGDDAAVLRPSRASELAISCDFSLEGIHFQPDYPPESIGYKSLVRAMSDLAAMGARPRFFLLALALPARKSGSWLTRLASGMSRAARDFKSKLIGGDTSKSALVTICVTVIGELSAQTAVHRSGAKPSDLVYVTGTLGAAQLGLEIILRGLSRRRSLEKYLRPHLYPKISATLGLALARQRIPSAMMDISDGLSTDLARLCAASGGVGAQIREDRLPMVQVPPSLLSSGVDPLQLALHGGDDYGLLFTAAPRRTQQLRRLARYAKITQIGEITRQRKIVLVHHDGHISPLPSRGWDPFRK
jgi:thiamine-monophosphate kinase